MIPFPNQKYQIIYADPCWQYENQMSRRDPRDPKNLKLWDVQVDKHYPTMTIQEISDLPVKLLADVNCLLFLWVASPLLDDGINVGKSWGFGFSTVAFVWEKQNAVPGNYTMSQCELCLVFKKGRIPQPRGKRNVRQFLSCKRGRHSEKPKEIRHRISEMFPAQAKIELFARPDWTDYDRGWDFWGNEV